MTVKKPNFFIAGAPKCGTTALYEYLKTHPNIFMPRVKEPHYFYSHKEKMPYAMRSQEQYLRLYEDAPQSAFLLGDSSTSYVWDTPSLARIREFNSESKLIVMIRNPVEMVYALHSTFLWMGWEDELDFKKAWMLQEARESGENIPKLCEDPALLRYRYICMNGEHLHNLYKIFPTEQVMIIIFDDFIGDTLAVYKKALEFLGAPYDGKTHFPSANESRFWKHPLLPGILDMMKRPWAKFKKLVGVQETGLWALVNSALTEKRKRPELSREFKEELLTEFIEDISELEVITGRDLSAWKTIK